MAVSIIMLMIHTNTSDPNNGKGNGNQCVGGGRTNTWDSQNRLVSCSYNGHNSTFEYGADGLRRAMTVDGIRTDFALDGQNVVREMRSVNGNMESIATYLTGSRGVEYRRNDTTQRSDGKHPVSWYLYDALGSVIGEIDEDYNVTPSPKLDVYGSWRTPQAGTSMQRFCGSLGHTSESENGMVYMRARYYDSVTGRFISEDPIGNGGNWFILLSE